MGKVLVTGGAGFIGFNLVKKLMAMNHEVTILDNLRSWDISDVKNLEELNIRLYLMDLSKALEGPFIIPKYDVIFHLASITDTTFKDDHEMIRQNVGGFESILKLAKNTKAKFIYASSAGVYGNGRTPMKENQKLKPLNAYAKSKAMIDDIARTEFDKMHIVGLRYFNVFGSGESYKGKSASMIYQLYHKMKKDETPRLFKFGKQKRDHIYVDDVVEATVKAIDAKSGIYNVGTGKATTFNEIVEILNEILKTDFRPVYFNNPYKEVYQIHTKADMAKAKKELNFKAKYSVKKGILDYIKHLGDKDIKHLK